MPDLLRLTSSTGSHLAALEWPGDHQRPFLLVHGLSSNARTWEGVGDRLAATGARVVAIDQRSHGQSEVTEDGYDFATYAADLATVIDQADLGRPVLAGQSWGGNVVVETAFRYPEQVSAVVGVDGGHIELDRRFPSWEACAEVLAPPRFDGIRWEDLETRIRAMHTDWSDLGIAGTLANFRPDANGGARPNLPFDRHMAILRSLYGHQPNALVAGLSMPSKLVAARSPNHPDGVRTAFGEVVLLDGDHDLHVQQPDLIAQHLLEVAPWA